MNPSPITFVSLKFLRVHVEADFGAQTIQSEDFNFDGAMLAWSLNHGKNEDGSWWVAVGFATSDDADSPRCAYNIDMQAMGVFRVSDGVEQINREALVFENGAALVYGAIREMALSITSRSVPGPLMLPTPSFMGAFKEHQKKLTQQQ